MAGAGAALDGGGVEPVDVEFVAHFFEKPEFRLAKGAIGGGHVAGERIGGLVEPFRKGLANPLEQDVEPVLAGEEIEYEVRDPPQPAPSADPSVASGIPR